MYDVDDAGEKHPFTAHTTNRVPFIVVDPAAKLTGIEDGRLSDIAPTMLSLAGIELLRDDRSHSRHRGLTSHSGTGLF